MAPVGLHWQNATATSTGDIMADDLSKRGPQDRSKISLTEKHEIAYWTKALGVSEAKLREAVKAVGNGAAKVKAHLGK